MMNLLNVTNKHFLMYQRRLADLRRTKVFRVFNLGASVKCKQAVSIR